MQSKAAANHYKVALFLRSENSKIYELNAYRRIILRVVADYCDMKYGYCSVKQPELAIECGMSLAQLKKDTDYLLTNKLLNRAYHGKFPRYRIGEIITGIEEELFTIDEILPAPIELDDTKNDFIN